MNSNGGQAIPAFDFYMAKGVLKSFRKHLRNRICAYKELRDSANIMKNIESWLWTG